MSQQQWHSRTEWAKQGRVVLSGEEPKEIRSWKKGDYGVYALEQTREKKQVVKVPAKEIDLLAAIFTVTRAAKRYRDAAAASYQSGAYVFATAHRERKEDCYSLKDRGIVVAYRADRITATKTCGPLTEYRGEGYCYHSLLRPADFQVMTGTETETLEVEAKPKGIKEPRLKDAKVTLSKLPSTSDGFTKLNFPAHPSKHRYAEEEYQDDDYDEMY